MSNFSFTCALNTSHVIINILRYYIFYYSSHLEMLISSILVLMKICNLIEIYFKIV